MAWVEVYRDEGFTFSHVSQVHMSASQHSVLLRLAQEHTFANARTHGLAFCARSEKPYLSVREVQ